VLSVFSGEVLGRWWCGMFGVLDWSILLAFVDPLVSHHCTILSQIKLKYTPNQSSGGEKITKKFVRVHRCVSCSLYPNAKGYIELMLS
jgi:hypothetical protein